MLLAHRYYDASIGRFISRDPIQDGYNWYAYCKNDPVNDIDPTGLIAIVDDLAVGGIVVIVVVGIAIVAGITLLFKGICLLIDDAINYVNRVDDDDSANDQDHQQRERRRQRGDGGAKNDGDYLLPPRGDQRDDIHDDLRDQKNNSGGDRNGNAGRDALRDAIKDLGNRGKKWKRD